MSWWFGCCCVCPCAASQFVRYQYRIKGSDVGGDLMAPYSLYLLAQCLSFLGPISSAVLALLIPYTVGKITQSLAETEIRGGGESQRYLSGYNPAPVVAHASAIN
jgi:hypothetical protein